MKQNFIRGALLCVVVGCLVGFPFMLGAPKLIAHAPEGSIRIPFTDLDDGCGETPVALQQELTTVGHSIDGTTGIAVRRVGCSWVAGQNLEKFFPQQSVSKLWVTLAILDAIDRKDAHIDEELAIGRSDLTLFHQPLRKAVLARGLVHVPVGELISDAITHSDNTANDTLLRRVGGPDEVRRMLQEKGLGGIRFGPGERLLQSGIAGIAWRPELSLGKNFDLERKKLPMAVREAALAKYVADPVDGATPSGITHALSLLASEQLLSPEASRYALDTLALTKSGPKRLKGGLPSDWKIYHKTGTGQELGPVSTGYNDVAILEAPDGARYAVAVMVGETTSPVPDRMKMMQAVTFAVTQHHLRSIGGTIAAR